MNVTLSDIVQRYSLESGNVLNFLVLRLPSGREVQAQVNDEDTSAVIQEAQPNGHEGKAGYMPLPETSDSVPVMARGTYLDDVEQEQVLSQHFEQPVPQPEADTVDWTQLNNEQLPPMVREVLTASNIDPVLKVQEFIALRSQILSKLEERNKTGKVTTQFTRQAVTRRAPIRTVPKDEMGYPLPPGGIVETDAGEFNEDEEEVQQG